MKRREINAIIARDLLHIPAAPTATMQLELRDRFGTMRRRDLLADEQAHAWLALARAIEEVRGRHPDFLAQYDLDYFAG